MVALDDVKTSNDLIPCSSPSGLVAVFVGGTSGIGEYTLKAFAKHASKPRIVNIGRNEKASQRIEKECKTLNADVEYEFIQADISNLSTVDDISRQLARTLPHINILFLTTGILGGGTNTSEGIHLPAALLHFSRVRFTLNLLPLIQRAPTLRRVVSVLAAGKEGPLLSDDIQGRDLNMRNIHRIGGHGASMVTFGLEKVAERAPEVTFIHSFPGPVRSNIGRSGQGAIMRVVNTIASTFILPFTAVPEDECGERHLFECTSARFAVADSDASNAQKPLEPATPTSPDHSKGLKASRLAKDTLGKEGGGVYCVDEKCEGTTPEVVENLEVLREQGFKDKIWEQTVKTFEEIRGSICIELVAGEGEAESHSVAVTSPDVKAATESQAT